MIRAHVSLFMVHSILIFKCDHSGMREESWHFLITFLENLAIEVLFSAEFDGMVQIIDFRQALHYKNYNLSF